MTRAQAWTLHASALAVGGTGLVYAWMRYLLEPVDELALVNHPLEPSFQHAHVFTAPLLVFACALVWSQHVWKRVRNGHRPRRPTGLVLFALFFPMVLSGVWIQVAEEELARDLAVWTHAGTGILWILAYGVHLVSRAEPRPGTSISAPPAR